MSATVFGTAKFGIASEASSTGLFAANINYNGNSEVADTVTLANTSADSLTVTTDLLKVTPVTNASVIVLQASLKRSNTGFEMGDLTCVYKPGINSTVTYEAS